MKVVYIITTGELVETMEDNGAVDFPYSLADAPANWDDYPMYFWRYVDPDVVLKEGAELAAAQAKQKATTAGVIVDRYTALLGNVQSIIGSMEEMMDLVVQITTKLMNGDAVTQDEKDAFNMCVTACAPQYKLALADVTQAIADAMLAKKTAARDCATAIKNDPDWPYAP